MHWRVSYGTRKRREAVDEQDMAEGHIVCTFLHLCHGVSAETTGGPTWRVTQWLVSTFCIKGPLNFQIGLIHHLFQSNGSDCTFSFEEAADTHPFFCFFERGGGGGGSL